jgi:hypothetical protein
MLVLINCVTADFCGISNWFRDRSNCRTATSRQLPAIKACRWNKVIASTSLQLYQLSWKKRPLDKLMMRKEQDVLKRTMRLMNNTITRIVRKDSRERARLVGLTECKSGKYANMTPLELAVKLDNVAFVKVFLELTRLQGPAVAGWFQAKTDEYRPNLINFMLTNAQRLWELCHHHVYGPMPRLSSDRPWEFLTFNIWQYEDDGMLLHDVAEEGKYYLLEPFMKLGMDPDVIQPKTNQTVFEIAVDKAEKHGTYSQRLDYLETAQMVIVLKRERGDDVAVLEKRLSAVKLK